MTDQHRQARKDVGRNAEQRAGQPERPDVSPEGAALDERLRNSPQSPNELDQTDESQKAADIRHAGEGTRRDRK